MNKVKFILGIIVAILAVMSVGGVINQILNYNGNAFTTGSLSASIFVTCFTTIGSIMLFKSANKKSESSEKDISEQQNGNE